MEGYTALADCYDRLMTGADYAGWADRIGELLRRNGIADGSLLLELGCGTGSMTLELARRGWDMTALDLSPDMLMCARAKLAEAGYGDALLLCRDMRDFELYGSMAGAVCVLDGINYLTDPRGLRRCFRNVHAYLDCGGLFLFDVNTPYKFREVFARRDYLLEGEGVYCGWRNGYDPGTGLCEFSLSIFKEGRDGTWRRYDETQYERCYGRRALTSALESAGFADIAFYAGYTDSPASDTDERWVVTAKRVKPWGNAGGAS